FFGTICGAGGPITSLTIHMLFAINQVEYLFSQVDELRLRFDLSRNTTQLIDLHGVFKRDFQ
ncbi:hypothetical protein LHU53_19630, partial [Rhodoferax sp. U2-2l]|uniref:hypothetical protein n=1 Tax=Rhodoferax sp. U2-2l TaxID=2884000 RepID=UPI001D0A953F